MALGTRLDTTYHRIRQNGEKKITEWTISLLNHPLCIVDNNITFTMSINRQNSNDVIKTFPTPLNQTHRHTHVVAYYDDIDCGGRSSCCCCCLLFKKTWGHPFVPSIAVGRFIGTALARTTYISTLLVLRVTTSIVKWVWMDLWCVRKRVPLYRFERVCQWPATKGEFKIVL